MAPERVARVAAALHALGCYEVSLGDTIGIGTPAVDRAHARRGGAHGCRCRRSPATTTTPTAWRWPTCTPRYEYGVRVFDSSVGGLGGCPYANGASGNVATEDVVYLLHGIGVDTGVDLERLVDCSAWISATLGRAPASRVAQAMLAKRAAVG